MKKRMIARKALAFSLSLVIAVTFIPMLGGAAFAEEAGADDEAITETVETLPDVDVEAEVDGDADVDVHGAAAQDTVDVTVPDPAPAATEESPEAAAPAAGQDSNDTAEMTEPADISDNLTVDPEALPSAVLNGISLDGDPAVINKSSIFSWKSYYTGLGHISAKLTGDKRFGLLYVFAPSSGSTFALKDFGKKTATINENVNLSGLDPGYYSLLLQVYNTASSTELSELWYVENIPVTISDKPTYKGVFEVYSKKLNIYPYNMTGGNASYRLYLEYSANGGKSWQRSGYMQRDSIKLYIQQGFTISGLKANKKYQTRLRYGVTATKADGSTGLLLGPPLNTGVKKTGKAKKPPIKSVKVKAVKVKFHKHRVAGHYEWTGYSYIWIGPYTEKYYTCKYKVTVKLKKKPGTKGIYINGKYLKGNKKKYTATFTPYPNYFTKKPPKGQKFKVTIKSYQAKSYGGFSPAYSKKKKVKR